MALHDLIEHAERHRTEVTVFGPEPWPELHHLLDGRNVTVRHEPAPDDGSGGFVAVHRDGRFRGALNLAAARALDEPPVAAVGDDTGGSLGVLVSMLAGTLFRSLDRRQLLATSREFEDRAWRVGTGTLHAGFQRRAALDAQRGTYERLASSDGLDVHVYCRDAWADDPIPGVTLHASDDREVEETWFVVYDGGDAPDQACALVAEERTGGSYEGVWTYDPEQVTALDGHLRTTYW